MNSYFRRVDLWNMQRLDKGNLCLSDPMYSLHIRLISNGKKMALYGKYQTINN